MYNWIIIWINKIDLSRQRRMRMSDIFQLMLSDCWCMQILSTYLQKTSSLSCSESNISESQRQISENVHKTCQPKLSALLEVIWYNIYFLFWVNWLSSAWHYCADTTSLFHHWITPLFWIVLFSFPLTYLLTQYPFLLRTTYTPSLSRYRSLLILSFLKVGSERCNHLWDQNLPFRGIVRALLTLFSPS